MPSAVATLYGRVGRSDSRVCVVCALAGPSGYGFMWLVGGVRGRVDPPYRWSAYNLPLRIVCVRKHFLVDDPRHTREQRRIFFFATRTSDTSTLTYTKTHRAQQHTVPEHVSPQSSASHRRTLRCLHARATPAAAAVAEASSSAPCCPRAAGPRLQPCGARRRRAARGGGPRSRRGPTSSSSPCPYRPSPDLRGARAEAAAAVERRGHARLRPCGGATSLPSVTYFLYTYRTSVWYVRRRT